MDRRIAIKNLALVLGGAIVFPSCLHKGRPGIKLSHVDVSQDQLDLITSVAETIIPKTDTPGAIALHLPDFVLKMLNDCESKEAQQTFFKGADEFADAVKKQYNKPFTQCTTQQREAALNNVEQKPQSVSKNVNAFFQNIKGLTVFGYTYSKFFMTKELVYELVPGRYNGYFPVSKLKGGPKFV